MRLKFDGYGHLDAIRWEIEAFDAASRVLADAKQQGISWVLNQIGIVWDHIANTTKAKLAFLTALEIDERELGPNHPKVATRLDNLGSLHAKDGDNEVAESFLRRALAIRETAFVDGKTIVYGGDVAASLCALANLLNKLDRFSEAEPLLRRALALCEQKIQMMALDTSSQLLRVVTSAIELFSANGRSAEVEPLVRSILQKAEGVLGDNPIQPHLDELRKALATTLFADGKNDEAETLLRQTLTIEEGRYGPDHRHVADTLHLLATMLNASGHPVEAVSLMRRALAIYLANWGETHPDVASSMASLASMIEALERFGEAEEWRKRALEIMVVLSRNESRAHPALGHYIGEYASLLKTMGHTRDQIISTLRELAPDFIVSEGEMARREASELAIRVAQLHREGHYEEAEPLSRQALVMMEKAFGPNHPEMVMYLNNLAALLYATNRIRDAEPLYRRELEIYLTVARTTENAPPELKECLINYGSLLCTIGYTPEQSLNVLKQIAPDFLEF